MRMNRRIVFLFAIVLLCQIATAQPNASFEDWGKVTMEELQMKECSFEKDADALLLLDLGQIDFSKKNLSYYAGQQFFVTTSYYQRYKVFSEKGVSRASFKHTLHIHNKEALKNIHAVSYNLVDGVIKKTVLSDADIRTNKLNEYQDQVSFSVPDVKAGTVFEVRYDREQLVTYTLPTWDFTSSIPSVRSSLTVNFLDAIVYYMDKHIMSGDLEEKFTPFTSDIHIESSGVLSGNSITYTTHDLNSYHTEPYTNSSKNYMNWIGFQLKGFRSPLNQYASFINNFSIFAQHTLDNTQFSFNLHGSGIPKREWRSVINDSMNSTEKARAIFEFVRSDMKWNGTGGYIPKENNTKIWKDKTGSKAEINILLINTLRLAGLNVYPIIVSSRNKGYVNNQYPILDDYVGVDAFVSLGGDTNLILDATVKYLPFGTPPFDQLYTKGLVLRSGSDNCYWYFIKDNTGNKEFASITGEIDESGHLTGEMSLYVNSYEASALINFKMNNMESNVNEYVKARIPNATIESVKDSQDAAKCTFYFKVKFSAQAPTDNEGNIYLAVPTVYGSTTNTFVNQERTSDVDFGYKSRADIVMQIKVPDSYVLDSIVPSLSLSTEDHSINFMYNAEMEDGTVVMRQKMEYYKSFYPVGQYPAFYEFFQKYYTFKQKPVILKKKS